MFFFHLFLATILETIRVFAICYSSSSIDLQCNFCYQYVNIYDLFYNFLIFIFRMQQPNTQNRMQQPNVNMQQQQQQQQNQGGSQFDNLSLADLLQ